MLTTKQCTKCNITKTISEFYKQSNSPTGSKPQCKNCEKKYIKEYYQKNKDEMINYGKKHYADNKELRKEKAKHYYQENKENIDKKYKKYYQKNKDEIACRTKKYQQSERGKLVYVNNTHKRRMILKCVSDGTLPDLIQTPLTLELQEILNLQNNKCFYCQCKISHVVGNIHLDHIIQVSKGGTHSLDNIQWLCATCNLSKHNKIITYPLDRALVPEALLS